MSLFMTHDGKPFFGGTYWPPDNRWGRPGFGQVPMAASPVETQWRPAACLPTTSQDLQLQEICPLIRERTAVNHQVTLYLCENMVCHQPSVGLAAITNYLDNLLSG